MQRLDSIDMECRLGRMGCWTNGSRPRPGDLRSGSGGTMGPQQHVGIRSRVGHATAPLLQHHCSSTVDRRRRSDLTDLVPQDLPSVADPICPGMNDGETYDRPEVVLGLRRPPNRHRWHRTGPVGCIFHFTLFPQLIPGNSST